MKNDYKIPPAGIETSRGHLYPCPGTEKQILFLVAGFFTAILLGFIVSSIPGDLSDFAEGTIYFIYILHLYSGLWCLGKLAWRNCIQKF